MTEEGSNFLSIKEVTIASKPQPTSSHLSTQHQQTKFEDLYTYPEAGGGGGGGGERGNKLSKALASTPANLFGAPHIPWATLALSCS